MFGITLDTTLMMRRRAQPSSIASPGELVAIESPEDIVADCAATGRASSLERARMRADHGMRYFCLREEGRSIAGAWITHTRRFLDEAMLLFELGPGDACMRDVFVAPGRRGERVFSQPSMRMPKVDGVAASVAADSPSPARRAPSTNERRAPSAPRHSTVFASALMRSEAASAMRVTGDSLRCTTRAPASRPQVASKLAKAMRPSGSAAKSLMESAAATSVSAAPSGQPMRLTMKRPGSA